jgi:hypothetical protein
MPEAGSSSRFGTEIGSSGAVGVISCEKSIGPRVHQVISCEKSIGPRAHQVISCEKSIGPHAHQVISCEK